MTSSTTRDPATATASPEVEAALAPLPSGAAPAPARIFDVDPALFRERFDRRAFPLRHGLADHPLFALDRLRALASYLSGTPLAVKFHAGDAAVDQRWHEIAKKEMTVEEAIDRVETEGVWILLQHVQRDPAYAALLERCVAEIEDLAGRPIRRDLSLMEAYIFISSPHTVTPYHIDHETNFLLQVRGDKTIHLFDGDDRAILPEEEIEGYYRGDLSAARWRPPLQERAIVEEMAPGAGVHNPPRWPHWVETGARVSVSLSINFFLRSRDPEARVYQANSYLRRLGLAPTPPGRSRWRDALKRLVFASPWPRRPGATKNEVLRGHLARVEVPLAAARWVARRLRGGRS